MAEGWLRQLGEGRVEAFSAGSRPAGSVHPLAVRAMSEVGVDISRHRSKPVSDFAGQPFDHVISVCDDAAETCPVFPGKAAHLHWNLEDPAHAEGDEAERMTVFRRVRDHLREQIVSFLAAIPA